MSILKLPNNYDQLDIIIYKNIFQQVGSQLNFYVSFIMTRIELPTFL